MKISWAKISYSLATGLSESSKIWVSRLNEFWNDFHQSQNIVWGYIFEVVYARESRYIQDYWDFYLSSCKLFSVTFIFTKQKIQGHIDFWSLIFPGKTAILSFWWGFIEAPNRKCLIGPTIWPWPVLYKALTSKQTNPSFFQRFWLHWNTNIFVIKRLSGIIYLKYVPWDYSLGIGESFFKIHSGGMLKFLKI